MTKQKKLRNLEYYGLQATFDKLYQRSQRGAVFSGLMDLIRSEENIKLAYRNIKRNRGSNTPGTDKQNISDMEKLSEEDYVQLIRSKLAWYKPKPVKRVEIPKPGGKLRPLGIPTIQPLWIDWYSNVSCKCWNQFAKQSFMSEATDSVQIVLRKMHWLNVIG